MPWRLRTPLAGAPRVPERVLAGGETYASRTVTRKDQLSLPAVHISFDESVQSQSAFTAALC